jgi:hypothetical protein
MNIDDPKTKAMLERTFGKIYEHHTDILIFEYIEGWNTLVQAMISQDPTKQKSVEALRKLRPLSKTITDLVKAAGIPLLSTTKPTSHDQFQSVLKEGYFVTPLYEFKDASGEISYSAVDQIIPHRTVHALSLRYDGQPEQYIRVERDLKALKQQISPYHLQVANPSTSEKSHKLKN